MSEKKSCASCAFCRDIGHGYSEYTITDNVYECLGSMNPGMPLGSDDVPPEKQAQVLEFAETCPAYREGQRLMAGLFVEDEKQEFADWAKQFQPGGGSKEESNG